MAKKLKFETEMFKVQDRTFKLEKFVPTLFELSTSRKIKREVFEIKIMGKSYYY